MPEHGNASGSRFAAAYECVKAFSETDFREDLKRIDVRTLVMHGDDDQIVPFNVGGAKSSKSGVSISA